MHYTYTEADYGGVLIRGPVAHILPIASIMYVDHISLVLHLVTFGSLIVMSVWRMLFM